MSDVIANLYNCHHCEGTGTCRNGREGQSCAACVQKNELKGEQIGLICGSCGGLGRGEPLTERVNKRTAPYLAVVLVIALLVLVAMVSVSNNPHFTEILTFASSIIGVVAGYYFSQKKQ